MDKNIRSSTVERHFDSLAGSYDEIKEKNSFYYQTLIRIVKDLVPPGRRVLDIGTGTGAILDAIDPAEGTGIDLSSQMIKWAQHKFPRHRFLSGSYETLDLGNRFDHVLLTDVIEHLESPQNLFGGIRKFCNPDTRVILTMANPAWEPILLVLEKLKLKMEEGPHHRISEAQLLNYAAERGFTLESSDRHLLFPARVPLADPFFNEFLLRFKIFKPAALIYRYTFRLASPSR